MIDDQFQNGRGCIMAAVLEDGESVWYL